MTSERSVLLLVRQRTQLQPKIANNHRRQICNPTCRRYRLRVLCYELRDGGSHFTLDPFLLWKVPHDRNAGWLSAYIAAAEEPGAGNPHATFCGDRRRATASGDPVSWLL